MAVNTVLYKVLLHFRGCGHKMNSSVGTEMLRKALPDMLCGCAIGGRRVGRLSSVFQVDAFLPLKQSYKQAIFVQLDF